MTLAHNRLRQELRLVEAQIMALQTAIGDHVPDAIIQAGHLQDKADELRAQINRNAAAAGQNAGWVG